jgi:predicted negative regulator of RcsB-dependent stress response
VKPQSLPFTLMFRTLPLLLIVMVCSLDPAHLTPEPAPTLALPPNTTAILDHIYSGRRDLALAEVHQLEEQAPEQPLGYLLEAEAEWWRIWCVSAEFKYGMTMARHHRKAPGDEHYLELTTRAYDLAEKRLKQQNTADMHLYAAMADALAARLYGLRGEYHATAKAGVRARENFLAALKMDPTLSDAYTGLGLYNYYVDTLSMIAKAMRFLMGIPGGTKEEGIRQLEKGMREGQLSSPLARFYLALNLFNYDQKYERALEVVTPLTEKYPKNPTFQLMRGDLNAKLERKEPAEAAYHAAERAIPEIPEADCRAKTKELVEQSLQALEQK